MLLKKDGGQPTAKPKPEDLIAEFKMKFDDFSSDRGWVT